MNKCPRCESDTLKIWNQCPKCGLKLEMTREQVIDQLKDLVKDRESFCVGDYDVVFELDIQALEYAIKELERTAQEVSVQEQLVECRNTKNVSIRNEDGITKVTVDGKEICGIRKLTFTHEAGKIPVANLEVYPKIVAIDSYLAFDVNTFFEKR